MTFHCYVVYHAVEAFVPGQLTFFRNPGAFLALGTAHKHTVTTGVYIYLATISVFLISNGLYLTTVYDEVNDPDTLCTISFWRLESVTTDNILNA